MTANAARRHRFTVVGAIVFFVGLVAVIAVTVVAVSTLRTSQEGRAAEVEEREVASFPQTPNAVIGVVDDLDRLSSLAILTLDPSGVGGSIVVLPVNVDETIGFGPVRLPLSRQPFVPGDEDDAARLVAALEPVLTLTLERSVIAGPDELAVLLEPLGQFEVDLPERVIDSDTPGSGFVARPGSSTLDTETMVDALTANDVAGTSYDHHETDVALWSAIADTAPATNADPPVDEFDRPLAPTSFDELWERLFAGDVGVRDLAIDQIGALNTDNETDADFVLASRPDALLVFGSISPGLVSAPAESLSLMLVVGFSEDEVAALGETADGEPITKASMTRRFIGEVSFAQANVIAVNLDETPGEIPDTTQLFVSSETFEAEVRSLSERFFGEAEVVVADRLIDAVDVVIVLGADFLVQRAELLEIERELAEQVESGEEEPEADFEVSDLDPEAGTEAQSEEPVGTSGPDTTSDPVGTSGPDTTSDTVVDDE